MGWQDEKELEGQSGDPQEEGELLDPLTPVREHCEQIEKCLKAQECLEECNAQMMLGKIEGTRRRGRQRTRYLDSVHEATSMSLTKLREAVEDCLACSGPWGHEESDTTKRLNNNNNAQMPSKSQTEEKCTEELFDFLHARNHCVAHELFSKLK